MYSVSRQIWSKKFYGPFFSHAVKFKKMKGRHISSLIETKNVISRMVGCKKMYESSSKTNLKNIDVVTKLYFGLAYICVV